MRITELFTAQSIALDEAQQDRSQIIDRLVELQATHGNIRDKEAYKKALYARDVAMGGLQLHQTADDLLLIGQSLIQCDGLRGE